MLSSAAPSQLSPATALLHHSVNQGDVYQAQALALEASAEVNASNSLGETCLHIAAARGRLSMMELLLGLGADPNVTRLERFGSQTPLHVAVKESHIKVVELLLEHDGDPNIPDAHGKTPLHDAARKGDLLMVELLLRHGCALNALDCVRKTAIDYAEEAHYSAVTQCLRAWLKATAVGDHVPTGSGAYPTNQARMEANEKLLIWHTSEPPAKAAKGKGKGKK